MPHLKFVCMVSITASAQVVQVIKVDIEVQISFPRGNMINQKTNSPNYSRSLLFEFHCYDDKRTKNIVPGLNPLY